MTYTINEPWPIILGLAVIWDLGWRGFALWRSARQQQQAWYIALLILNTVGILPIIYLLTNRRTHETNHGSH